MIKKIKTASGFECEIDSTSLADMELLDAILEVESAEGNNKLIYYNKIMKKLLPEETKQRLYDHIRTDSGRVPPEAFEKELLDIFAELDKKKS